LGCAVIDGDAIAREVTLPGSLVLGQLATRFGEDILHDGILDRKLLAKRAFADKESRLALNRITHPAITDLALEQAAQLPSTTPAIVLDAAALLESGLMQFLDHIIFAQAPENIRLKRIMARDGLSKEMALHRINAQRDIQYVPPVGLGYTILKSDESEWSSALSQIMEGLI